LKGNTALVVLKYLFYFLFLILAPSFARAVNCIEPNSIVSVSNSKSGRFEYVTFKFKTPPALPQFSVSNVVPPFIQDDSGETTTVLGTHWTQVKFERMNWTCSTRQLLSLPKTAIKAVKNIEQFEGQIVYVIGRSAASHFISAKATRINNYMLIKIKFRI
jgi:hypothetical protein